MKKWWIALTACAVLMTALFVTWPNAPTMMRLGNADFALRVARTEQQREQGLSGTTDLADSEALLFVFPSDEQWGIWMKDMNYPIDIVWLSADKKVIHIVPNAQPSSYPNTSYQPPRPARYVIELKAGAASSKRITIGSQAVFDSTKGTFE